MTMECQISSLLHSVELLIQLFCVLLCGSNFAKASLLARVLSQRAHFHN